MQALMHFEFAPDVGLLHKYSRLMLKGLSGLIRLLMEDLLNIFVQACFLVKVWDLWNWPVRAFTITSMMAGLTCSCAGPIKDLMAAPGQITDLMPAIRSQQWHDKSRLDRGAAVEKRLGGGAQVDETQGGEPDVAEPTLEAAEGADPESLNVQALEKSQAPKRRKFVHYTGRLTDFLADDAAEHSQLARRLLIICSIAYWTSMALIPVFFGSGIKGGAESSVPSGAIMYFMVVNIASVMVELWVGNHLEHGAYLTMYCCEAMKKAFGGKYEELKALIAAGLSIVGRYDTFTDTVFCIILSKTPPITELHFSNTLGTRVHLPFELYHIALFSLVFGVFVFQGIPGVLFIIWKKYLPAGLKLNEFNFLLALMEYEEADEAREAALDDYAYQHVPDVS